MAVDEVPELMHICWPHDLRDDIRGQNVVKE